jgi:hypothetical protein
MIKKFETHTHSNTPTNEDLCGWGWNCNQPFLFSTSDLGMYVDMKENKVVMKVNATFP